MYQCTNSNNKKENGKCLLRTFGQTLLMDISNNVDHSEEEGQSTRETEKWFLLAICFIAVGDFCERMNNLHNCTQDGHLFIVLAKFFVHYLFFVTR